MRPGTPGFSGDRLRQAREARGLTQVALAELVSERAGRLSNRSVSLYERGETTPHPEVAKGLANALNVPLELFFSGPTSAPKDALFWRSRAAATASARARANSRYEWFLEIVDYLRGFKFFDFPPVNFLDLDSPTDLTDISSDYVENAATKLRRYWNLGDGPISNVVHLLENNGAVVAHTELVAETLDAFSDWREDDDRPYIVLGSDGRTRSRARFNAAHELGHMVLHRNVPRSDFKNSPQHKLSEKQAMFFAGAFLLPSKTFPEDFLVPQLSTLLVLKEKWGVSAKAMLMRAKRLRLIDRDDELRLWRGYSRRRAEDYETDEPERPVLVRDAMTRLIEEGLQSRQQVLNSLKFSARDIEDLIGLERGILSDAPRLRLRGDDRRESDNREAQIILFPEHHQSQN